MLEVNNEVSAEAVSQSVMTVTDFHLGGDFKKTYKMRGAEVGMRKNLEALLAHGKEKRTHVLHFLPCICKRV